MPNSYRLMPERHEAIAVRGLDLHRLYYFVTFAEELDFVRAADLVQMTRPALSARLAR
jgi:hypothetical protein